MNFFFGKRKILFFSSLFLALFIFLFTPISTHAAWYDFLIGAVTFIPNVAIALIFYLLVVTTGLLAGFAGVILKWVISPTFISLSYTKPGFNTAAGENPIIATGLGITQGFVNMILVLILIYIALATILRLAGYETKKLLVTFVIVALLVNFAPVICGLIVDASNIVMNYFVQNLTGGQQLINSLKSIIDVATANFNWEVFKVTSQISVLAYFLMLAVFNFFLMIALGLFAAVFLIRYIAIWILVILSPLAFACYILPVTKKYWSLWWNQFLQWSFIGAIAGFFLYLGEQIAALSPSIFKPPSGELGSAILPYLVPLAFLYLGLMVGFSTSAMGASTVIGLTKRSQKWVGGKAGTALKQRAEERLRLKEGTGRAVKALETVPVLRAFIPETVRKYGEQRPAVDEAEKELDTHSSLHIAHRMLEGDIYGVKAVGGLSKLISRGDSQDFFKGAKDKYKAKTDDDLYQIPEFRNKITRLLQIAANSGKIQPIVRGDPRLAAFAAGIGPYRGLTQKQAIEKATIESRRNHIANWEPEVLQNETVVNSLLTKGRESFEAIDSQVKKGQETALRSIDKIFSEFVDKSKDKFPKDANLWKEFRKEVQTRIQTKEPGAELKGYFAALDDNRFRARGWREGKYLTKEQREMAPPVVPAAPLSPGAAVGITPPKDTGKTAAKKRKEPDTGRQ